jgi:hypothetical protein
MHSLSRSPITLLLLALLLGIPQLVGFSRQFGAGFRPFGAAPGRVTLSWDMFATRIERCGINWNPALPGGIFELSQKSRAVEWQAVADTRAGYERIAAWACSKYHRPLRALLTCFLPSGKGESRVVECN